jgi:hypothetical protein
MYSIVPDDGSGDFDFARNSGATYIGADGLIKTAVANEPRIDFGTDGKYRGLLSEVQSTNLVFPSDVATTQTRTLTAGEHTISFFGTGEVVLSGTASGTLTGTGANDLVQLQFTATAGAVTFTVTGSVTNWQVERTPRATSRIVTVSSAVTRVTDVLSNDLSALVTGDYSMLLDVEANVGRLKVFEALTGFEVDLTGSGRMVVTVDTEITLHFPDGRTLEFLKPSDFVDLEFVTKLTSNHIKVVAAVDRILSQSEIDGLTSGDLNSPLLDTGSLTSFQDKYNGFGYDFFGKIDTSNGTVFSNAWAFNNLTSFPLIDTSSGINFLFAWRANNLTSFPLINTSSGTSFAGAWRDNNLETFPLIDTSSGTVFTNAWGNNNLTSFPFIDTSSGINFSNAWRDNNLTSFPLINTSSGTSFQSAWQNNNLTSFPLINTSSGTNFASAWRDNNLQTWPANMFDTCPATNFANCWLINALDQTGVDNILVSINKARVDGFSGSNGILSIHFGTNATPGAAGQAAADALRADGWTVILNGY